MCDSVDKLKADSTGEIVSRKRKSLSDLPADSKKPKMGTHKFTAKEDAWFERMKQVWSDDMAPIKESIERVEGRLDSIENQNEEKLALLKEEIKSELKEEIDSKGEVSYHMLLAQQVALYEKNLIVLGLASGDPKDRLLELGKKIGLTEAEIETIQIKRWYRLGKVEKDSKPPPCMLCFGQCG